MERPGDHGAVVGHRTNDGVLFQKRQRLLLRGLRTLSLRVERQNATALAVASQLAKHPAVIVQGRYDMVCPITTADRLARAWTGAQYRVVPDAGHSSMEPGIRAALVKATEDFKLYR